MAGLAILIVSDLVLAFAGGVGAVVFGAALWGLHMGLTQGLFAALVADTAPADLRGTGFGLFNLLTGLAALAASLIAGALWGAIGPQATFFAGAIFTACTLAALPLARAQVRGPGALRCAAAKRAVATGCAARKNHLSLGLGLVALRPACNVAALSPESPHGP